MTQRDRDRLHLAGCCLSSIASKYYGTEEQPSELFFNHLAADAVALADATLAALSATAPPAPPVDAAAPIPMVLFCPVCREQHVDRPEPDRGWTNPPHKSHLCHRCGVIWRPADVPTVGVEATATRGEKDTWDRVAAPATPDRVRCHYCGFSVPKGRDDTTALISAHIAECPKHPLRAMVRDNARLRQVCGDAAAQLATMTCPTLYADACTHDAVVRMLREAADPRSRP